MARTPIDYVFASKASNKKYPSGQEEIEGGIIYQSEVISSNLNGISEKMFSAMREAQVMGGFYDNNQIYNKNDFVCQLVQEEGVVKILYFYCKQDNTTGKPPLFGNSASNFNDVNIIVLDPNIYEDTTNWGRVNYKNLAIAKITTAPNQSYVLIDTGIYYFSYSGKIKVTTYGSRATGCYFEIVFNGSTGSFRIQNVFYSPELTHEKSSLTPETPIGFPGFFLSFGGFGSKLLLSVKDTKYCGEVTVDYSEANFFFTPSQTEYSISYPYAIREGGGTYIPDLGDVKQNLIQHGIYNSYEFYLFARGCVQWIKGVTLDSRYYHQWAGYRMESVSMDAQGCYIVNRSLGYPLDAEGRVQFDASKSSLVYQERGTARAGTITATFLLQAF